MARPHLLKGLQVNEISLVDAPANPGALHILFKRKAPTMTSKTDAGALDRLLQRLGIGKKAPAAVDPDSYRDAAGSEIDEATTALTKAIASILGDEKVTDKNHEIAKSLAQFRSHTSDKVGEQIEKAMRDVALATTVTKDDAMPTMEEMTASLAEMSKKLADTEAELAKAKKEPPVDDAAAAAASAKKKKEAAEAMGKSAEGALFLEELKKSKDEAVELAKRVAVFEAERELAAMKKRAAQIGATESQADLILKASKGDAKAFEAVLDMVKAANAQAKAGAIFKEFGGTGHAAPEGSAKAEVDAMASTLVKADPKLSLIHARVAVRKGNAELAQRERDEERAAMRAHA